MRRLGLACARDDIGLTLMLEDFARRADFSWPRGPLDPLPNALRLSQEALKIVCPIDHRRLLCSDLVWA